MVRERYLYLSLRQPVRSLALYMAGCRSLQMLTPTDADVAQESAGLSCWNSVKGLCCPPAAWLPAQAGHEPSLHLIALSDVDDRAIRIAVRGDMDGDRGSDCCRALADYSGYP